MAHESLRVQDVSERTAETLPEVRTTWLPEWLPSTVKTFELIRLPGEVFTFGADLGEWALAGVVPTG